MYEASLSCSPTQSYIPKTYEENENSLPQQHTGIVDSVATHLYIAPNAPHGPLDTSAATIKVGTANGQVATSAAKSTLPIKNWQQTFLQRDTSFKILTTHSLVLDPSVTQNVP